MVTVRGDNHYVPKGRFKIHNRDCQHASEESFLVSRIMSEIKQRTVEGDEPVPAVFLPFKEARILFTFALL
jgi:hypothetical protein